MSSQSNAWQTARGNRHSSSRTPQTRSGTASPSQPNAPSQPPPSSKPQEPKQQAPAPAPAPSGNVWAQRSAQQSAAAASSAGSNGPPPPPALPLLQEEPSVNGFNSAEVRAFLSREPAPPAAYKPQDGPGSNSRASGGVWGAKTNHMASGQPFFVQLSKQVAAFQEGG
ncbi:Hypothetical predicted protein [Lecanosticta acicola]|uniref:Uncharacterized protein n=1 Tax=Lecanosticta acicola TaxID=111012 RepID=A0AAI8YUE5_9PEZI|nr:Hypothetical predicted protein [Lecanosticta acicola]